jgi:RHS repeat-associated protein
VGRLVRTEIERASGPPARVDREYDGCGSCSGRAARVSTPYLAGGQPEGWAETVYDGLGRVRKVIPPDGTAASNFTEYRYRFDSYSADSNSHPVRLVGVFDPTGRRRVSITDMVTGQLLEVRENAAANFTSSTVTTYRVRPDTDYLLTGEQRNGQPIRYAKWMVQSITQGVQTRTLRSDGLGRLVSETHPENGTTTYAWDDAGNLVLKTDARGVTTGTTHDVLGRPTLVQYSDATPSVSRAYDLGDYGIGRLHWVSNAHASSVYLYDKMGRVVQRYKSIGGLVFGAGTSYNLAGQPVAETLPNGTAIAYGSTTRSGRLEAILSDWVDAQHPGVLASNFAWDAAGRLTSVEFGNGTTSTRTYNVGGQLKTLSHGTPAAPGSLVDYEYDYDEYGANNGTIRGIVNHRDRTKDVQFAYDAFYRLSAAETAGSHWGLQWTYDRYGNRLSQTASKGTPPIHSLTVNTSTNRVSGWSYDAAGNTTNDGSRTYAYDANNRITQAGGGSPAEYRYDGEGNRVMKVVGSDTIRYVMGLAEHSTATGWRALYVYLGSEKLVEYRYANSTRFFHNDHLGTTKAVTDHTGAVLERWDHYPFGEEWVSGLTGDRYRYTGHLRDQETGNDYAGARYYANARGRWLSVDPVRGNVANPQRLNRYSYVGNDPINLADPDGREWLNIPCSGKHIALNPEHIIGGAGCWVYDGSRAGPGGAGGSSGQGGVGGEAGGRGGGVSLLPDFVGVRLDSYHMLGLALARWISPECAQIFSGLGTPMAVLRDIVENRDLEFVDMTDKANWKRRLSEVFPRMGGFFPQDSPGGARILSRETREGVTEVSTTVLLYASFWSGPARYQGLVLVHELLHYATQLGDAALAERLKLSFEVVDDTRRTDWNASNAIQAFLMGGCKR